MRENEIYSIEIKINVDARETTYRIAESDTLRYVEIWMSQMQMQWLNEMDHVLNYVLSLICLSLIWRSYRPHIFRRPNTSFLILSLSFEGFGNAERGCV